MKSIRIHYHIKRASVFLIIAFLLAGMGGCETSCTPAPVLQHNLVVSSSAGGSVTLPGEGIFAYDAGTTVNLKAVADECYKFVNWTGDTVANPASATTTIIMDTAKSVTANFALLAYGLTVNSTEGGSVTVPGEGSFLYTCGTTTNLKAEAEDGYRFVEWTGNIGTIANPAASQTTITINEQYSITAVFVKQYSLNISSTEGGSVTVPGEGAFTYDENAVADLVAEAEESYSFSGWTGDIGNITDPGAAQTTITMEGHYSIVASFILFTGGNGTAENPYQIEDWRQLDNIRNYLDSHFILTTSLDFTSAGYEELASQTANEGKGWQPIGAKDEGFTGTFDGQGHEINDLFVYRPDQDRVGLFGEVDENGTVENVRISGDLTGNERIGTLAGDNKGSINNCHSVGSINGNQRTGGLVGHNEGIVRNSHSACEVVGSDNIVGGLVGQNEGIVEKSFSEGSVSGNNNTGGLVGKNNDGAKVTDSYSTGNVNGASCVGGLVGKNDKGAIENAYSTGSVSGSSYLGGLVGKNDDGTATNSFWDTETSGQAVSSGGTGKTTAEMQDISTFATAEWDISAVNQDEIDDNHIWNIVDGEDYPFLSILG